jgi:hypothetical protein
MDINVTSLNVPVLYYRLKMVDINGKFSYSKTIAIGIKGSRSVVLLYPNPVKDNATLMISVKQNENVTLQVFDYSGKLVQANSLSLQQGSNLLTIDISQLASGLYTVQAKGSITSERVQLVKH